MTRQHTISIDDVELEPGSIVDPSGQLFYWNGRVFRGIQSPAVWDVYRRLLASDLRNSLFAHGLVQTWIPDDVHLEGSAGLLEHKRIDFVTCRAEWTLRMLWDAARRYIQCAAILAQEDMILKDCHPWNVLFDFCEPTVVDFGSIVHKSSSSSWLDELRIYFILPLWLAKFGRGLGHMMAMDMMREHLQGIGVSLARVRYARYFPPGFYRLTRQYGHAIRSDDVQPLARFFHNLQRCIEGLQPVAPKEYWTEYQQGDETQTPAQKQKQDKVLGILKSWGLDSMLDMGANKGWYAFTAESLGYKVIAFDYEEHCVDQMYLRGQAEKKRVLPLHMDFLHPTPQSGVGLSLESSFDRLRCDVSLVLGLIHHLALHQGVSFDAIARIVDRYTRDAAIVEFVSREDEHIRNWTIPSDYTMDNFIKAMGRRGFLLDSRQPVIPSRDLLAFKRTTHQQTG